MNIKYYFFEFILLSIILFSCSSESHDEGDTTDAISTEIANNRCNASGCSSFGKEVSSSHQHNSRCNNGGCSAFGDYVSKSHKHNRKCTNAFCDAFGDYVRQNHRCSN